MKKLPITEYDASLGEFTMPEGAEDILKALPLDKQVELFSMSVSSTMFLPHEVTLHDCSDFKSLIVKDGIIIGAMISNAYGLPEPCFIGETACTWDSEDNNGAGYKSRTDYATLLFNSKK